MEKDFIKSDDKNFNLSLMGGLIVAEVTTLFSFMEEWINQGGGNFG
jgi:predicted transcriptional regulator